MIILPAIDIYDNKAVRLLKGDYNKMTVYDDNPVNRAIVFKDAGATWIHVVDLKGARDGDTPAKEVVENIIKETGLLVEVGGGIRDMTAVDAYLSSGVSRVIIGTAAVTDEEFLKEALEKYGEKIAVGADIKDRYIAIKGWVEKSQITTEEFFNKMEALKVKTIICTDISKDGAMEGTNRNLYKELSDKYSINIIASGGVSSLDDVKALKETNVYGAIIGKACYTGDIDLKEAFKV